MKDFPEHNLQIKKEQIWHGGHSGGNRKYLKAGLLSMVYENGNIRHISLGSHEIIRMIYMAVRNNEWLTIDPVISDEELNIGPDYFTIKYNSLYSFRDVSYSARFYIEGRPDNSVSFKFKGEALGTFEKNRIGICVLHPIKELAGKDCLIEKPDTELKISQFPSLISPHQPFTDISLMHWNVSGISCRLDFFGDVFETEDQRNWTDASYKTYSTPLRVPYPATVKKGDQQQQKIVLRIKGVPKAFSLRIRKNKITIDSGKTTNMPRIGIGRSTRPQPLSDNEITILKKLEFDHYRTDLYLFSKHWKSTADEAAVEAERLGYPLELALFFNDNATEQAVEFINWAEKLKPLVSVINLFHQETAITPDRLTDALSPLFMDSFPGAMIGCGTNANFAQLNRERPNPCSNDLICYSIHPQEHASDNTTITENLEAQGHTVESARSFVSKGLWISPVNLRRRFNANSEKYENPYTGNSCPPQVDSRIMSLFGAGWTAGSMKYLFRTGISGVTYYETAGERGIIQGDFPSRWPDEFPSSKGMIFPVFFVFSFVLQSKSFRVVESTCSNVLNVDVLALTDGECIKLILMNFTQEIQEVSIGGFSGKFIFKELNSVTYPFAAFDPDWLEHEKGKTIVAGKKIAIEPFSVNFLEEIRI